MQIIHVLGTQLKDRTKWESLGMAERYLKERAMRIILYLNNNDLSGASSDDEFKQFVEQADLTLWSAADVAQVAGLKNDRRHREVDNKEFLHEFLHRLAKNHHAVMLISDSEQKVDALREDLHHMEPGLSVVSRITVEYPDERLEQTINEINGIAPTVIIARMPVKKQYLWLRDAKNMVSAGIWLAMPEDMVLAAKKAGPIRRLYRKIKKLFFFRKVKKYNTASTADETEKH